MSGREVLQAKGTVSAKAPREKHAWHVWVMARHPARGKVLWKWAKQDELRKRSNGRINLCFRSLLLCLLQYKPKVVEDSQCIPYTEHDPPVGLTTIAHGAIAPWFNCTEINHHRHGLFSKAQLHYMDNSRAWKLSLSFLTLKYPQKILNWHPGETSKVFWI